MYRRPCADDHISRWSTLTYANPQMYTDVCMAFKKIHLEKIKLEQTIQTKLGCFFVRLSLLHTKCPVVCSFLTYNFLLMSKCPLLCTIQHVLLFPSSLRTYQGFPIFPTERAMTSDPNTSLRGQRINIPCQHKWGKPLASFYSLIQSLRTVPDLPLMTLTLFTLYMDSKHQQQNICILS